MKALVETLAMENVHFYPKKPEVPMMQANHQVRIGVAQ